METVIEKAINFINKKLSETTIMGIGYIGDMSYYCLSPESRKLLITIKNILEE